MVQVGAVAASTTSPAMHTLLILLVRLLTVVPAGLAVALEHQAGMQAPVTLAATPRWRATQAAAAVRMPKRGPGLVRAVVQVAQVLRRRRTR